MNSEDNNKTNTQVSNEQQLGSNNIVLPDIETVKPEKHVPTVEEIAAAKKAEEQRIKEIKNANHDNNFNAKEQTLYTVEEEKEGNPLVILAFFIILVVFIVILPKVPRIGGNISDFFSTHTSTPSGPTIVEEEETKHKFNDAQTRVSIGGLELTNFVKSYQNQNYELNFTIINSTDDTYIYDKKYYIVLYDEDKIIYRALIHSYEPLASKAAKELSLIISKRAYDSANYFELQEITESQYPKITMTKTDGDYQLLTCTYNNDTMEYSFEDDTLVKIKETYNETNDITTYQNDKTEYNNISNRYKEIEGMTSTFVETPTDFTMITEFNLKDVQDRTLADLKNYKFFKFRTSSKTVAFEISSLGYTCDSKE